MISVSHTALLTKMYESVVLYPVETRAPGTYLVRLNTHGNALLSSIYVVGGGGTVTLKYYDAILGGRYDLNRHDDKDGTLDAGETDRIVVTTIHDGTFAEITVAGSSVTFGVYATLIAQPAGSAFEGLAIARQPALPALVAKTAAGNLTYLNLTASGKVPVDTEADPVTRLKNEGEIPGTTTETTVCAIPLTVNKVYRDVSWLVSCFRNTKFRIIFHNNGVDTVLGRIRVGDNHPNDSDTAGWEFTAGSTGTQELRLRGANITALSDFSGSLGVKEVGTN